MPKNKLSLSELVAHLLRTAPKAIPTEEHGDSRVTTSIRLSPELRTWVKSQAEHLDISIQDFITLTLKGVMEASQHTDATELDTVVTRFFQLFKAHGIDVIDIPKYLPSKQLKTSDLKHNEKIIDYLTDEVLDELSCTFNIEKNWLKGADDLAHSNANTFYKNFSAITSELTKLSILGTGVRDLELYLITPPEITLESLNICRKKEIRHPEHEVCVVIKHKKLINDNYVDTYQLWDTLPWGYELSRYYLKSLMYFCDQASIYISGQRVPRDIFNNASSGKALLSEVFDISQHWYLEELVWNDERNTELDELQAIIDFFKKENGNLFLDAIKRPYQIKNREAFLDGKEFPKLNCTLNLEEQ